MYFKRSYEDPFFGQTHPLRDFVRMLTKTKKTAPLNWTMNVDETKSHSVKMQSLDWSIRAFDYYPGGAKGSSSKTTICHTGYMVSPQPSASVVIKKIWVIFGGSAMLAFDWLPFLEEMCTKFNAPLVRSMLKTSHVLSDRQRGKLNKWVEKVTAGGRIDITSGLQDAILNQMIVDGKATTAFLLLDYPGYGNNQTPPGSPSELEPTSDTIYESTLAAIEYVQANTKELFDNNAGITDSKDLQFSALGHSFGCAALLDFHIKSESRFADLIISAPFSSIPEMATQRFPFIPFNLAKCLIPSHHAWRNDLAVDSISKSIGRANIGTPNIYITHGEVDEVCPFEMGQRLAGKLSCSRWDSKADSAKPDLSDSKLTSFISWSNTGHDDLLVQAKWLYALWIFVGDGWGAKL